MQSSPSRPDHGPFGRSATRLDEYLNARASLAVACPEAFERSCPGTSKWRLVPRGSPAQFVGGRAARGDPRHFRQERTHHRFTLSRVVCERCTGAALSDKEKALWRGDAAHTPRWLIRLPARTAEAIAGNRARSRSQRRSGVPDVELAHRRVRLPTTQHRRLAARWRGPANRWQDYYDPRDAVERVNSRLAGGFGFERPGILGLSMMHLRGTVAMTIMQPCPWGPSAPGSRTTCGVWSAPPDRRPLPVTREAQTPPTAPPDRAALSCPAHRR